MAKSKTFIFKKPAVQIQTSTGTTYTTQPTTVTGTGGERRQVFVGGEKRVEYTGEGGVVRVPVKTPIGTEWVEESKAEAQIQSLQKQGLTRTQAEDRVLAGQVLREPGVKLREQEYLTRTLTPSPQGEIKGELLPRKQLIGRVNISEPQTLEGQMFQQEEIKPKSRLELFSPAAREKLRLSESQEGLLEVGVGEGRKLVISPKGELLAELPASAQYSMGFGSHIGTGEHIKWYQGLPTPSGILSFKTIGGMWADVEKKVAEKTTHKLLPEYKEIKQKTIAGEEIGMRAWELKHLPSWFVGKKITEESFDKGFRGGAREMFYEYIREKPVKLAGFIATTWGLGKLASVGLIKGGKYAISTKILGTSLATVYAGTKGYQLGAAKFAEEPSYERGKLFSETILEVSAMMVGGRLSQVGKKPNKVSVTKAKSLTGEYIEALKLEGKKAKGLIRYELPTEIKTRVLQTKVKPFVREVTSPKDINKLLEFSGRKDIRTIYGLKQDLLKGISEPIFYQNIPSKTRFYNIEPEPFEISVEGKISAKIGESEFVISKDVKGISRIIDPTLYKQIQAEKGYTILEKATTEQLPKKGFLTALLQGKGTITGMVTKKVEGLSNIFGLELQIPVTIETTATTQLIGKPILSVTPIFEPSPLLLAPLNIFDVIGERKRKPIMDVTKDLRRTSIQRIEQARIQQQRPISDVTKIIDSIQGTTPIQKPIIDVSRIQDRTQISAIALITGQVTDQVYEEPPIEPPEFKIPKVPGGGFWFPPLDFWGGEGILRGRKPLRQTKAYTPDFIASVLNQFGRMPKKGMWTGQERRYKVKGRKFVSPLPEVSNGGIFGLIKTQLGG